MSSIQAENQNRAEEDIELEEDETGNDAIDNVDENLDVDEEEDDVEEIAEDEE
jgi:hypothetical protein